LVPVTLLSGQLLGEVLLGEARLLNGFVHRLKLWLNMVEHHLPSGKRLHNYGKSPFSMGKSTINGHFQ